MIRTARPADVPTIMRMVRGLADYEQLLHQVTVTDAELREALFGPVPRINAILAEVEGDPVGMAIFYYTFNTFRARRHIFLEDLFVDPAHRRAGIGLALMRHLAGLVLAQNCGRIEWRVLNWNQPAIDFYRQLGAQPIRHLQTLLLDGDALVALAEGTADG